MPERNQLFIFGVFAVFVFFVFFFVGSPGDFPKGTIIEVKQGDNLRNITLRLKEADIIRSRAFFEAFVILFGGEKHIIPADYLFENKTSVIDVAKRIVRGESGLAPIKATIPEGFSVSEIAKTFSLLLSHFDETEFLSVAEEGYLFPDTYFFFTIATEKDVIKYMSENFNKKISVLENEIAQSGKSMEDIIKMASVIEKEAKGEEDRDLISGILWRRHKLGMLLQADAAPETYEKGGLPSHPIVNPGLSSIRAAIHPKTSPYLYYLHDKEGNIYFARSFTEHRKNIEKYLK